MVPPLTVLDRAFVNPAGSDIIRPLLQPLVDDPDQVGELLGRKKVQVSEQGFRSDRFPGYTTDRLEPLVQVSGEKRARALDLGDGCSFLENLDGHLFENFDQPTPDSTFNLRSTWYLTKASTESGLRSGGAAVFFDFLSLGMDLSNRCHPLSSKQGDSGNLSGSVKSYRFRLWFGKPDRRNMTDLGSTRLLFLDSRRETVKTTT